MLGFAGEVAGGGEAGPEHDNFPESVDHYGFVSPEFCYQHVETVGAKIHGGNLIGSVLGLFHELCSTGKFGVGIRFI